MLQSTNLAPFNAAIPAISRLDLLRLKPEKNENMSNTFIKSIKDSLSFRENAVPSAYAVYKNVWLDMLRLFMFLFFLVDKRTIYRTTVNK